MSVEGNGFEAETVTDAEGKWRLYVPEKETYVLTVDEATLPDGVIVDGTAARDVAPVRDTRRSSRFGLTNTKIVNLFLGEGERVTTSFVDQFIEPLDERPQLRPAARPRRDGRCADLRHDGPRRTSPTARWSRSAPSSALVLGVVLEPAVVARHHPRHRRRRRVSASRSMPACGDLCDEEAWASSSS